MAEDTSISAKTKEQIQAIEVTDEQLTTRACLMSFFAIYLRSIKLFPCNRTHVWPTTEKQQWIANSSAVRAVICFFMDGTNPHLTGIDQLKKKK